MVLKPNLAGAYFNIEDTATAVEKAEEVDQRDTPDPAMLKMERSRLEAIANQLFDMLKIEEKDRLRIIKKRDGEKTSQMDEVIEFIAKMESGDNRSVFTTPTVPIAPTALAPDDINAYVHSNAGQIKERVDLTVSEIDAKNEDIVGKWQNLNRAVADAAKGMAGHEPDWLFGTVLYPSSGTDIGAAIAYSNDVLTLDGNDIFDISRADISKSDSRNVVFEERLRYRLLEGAQINYPKDIVDYMVDLHLAGVDLSSFNVIMRDGKMTVVEFKYGNRTIRHTHVCMNTFKGKAEEEAALSKLDELLKERGSNNTVAILIKASAPVFNSGYQILEPLYRIIPQGAVIVSDEALPEDGLGALKDTAFRYLYEEELAYDNLAVLNDSGFYGYTRPGELRIVHFVRSKTSVGRTSVLQHKTIDQDIAAMAGIVGIRGTPNFEQTMALMVLYKDMCRAIWKARAKVAIGAWKLADVDANIRKMLERTLNLNTVRDALPGLEDISEANWSALLRVGLAGEYMNQIKVPTAAPPPVVIYRQFADHYVSRPVGSGAQGVRRAKAYTVLDSIKEMVWSALVKAGLNEKEILSMMNDVLEHLIENAIDAVYLRIDDKSISADQGVVSFSVTGDKKSGNLRIVLSDNGIGMSKELMDKLSDHGTRTSVDLSEGKQGAFLLNGAGQGLKTVLESAWDGGYKVSFISKRVNTPGTYMFTQEADRDMTCTVKSAAERQEVGMDVILEMKTGIRRVRRVLEIETGIGGVGRVGEKTVTAVPVQADTIASRRAAVTEAFKDANGRGIDVRVVQGVPKGGMPSAMPVANEISRILAKSGYGVLGERQIFLFEINLNDPGETESNMRTAISNANDGLPAKGRVVIFVPQMDNGPKLADKFEQGPNVTVLNDAYKDYDYPGMIERMGLARMLVWLKDNFTPDDRKAFLDYLGKMADPMQKAKLAALDAVDNWEDILKKLNELTIRIMPIDYTDIDNYQRSQIATATSA